MQNYKLNNIRISSRETVGSIARGHKGWIDPDGNVLALDNEFDTHDKWILNNYDKLKKRYPNLPSIEDLKRRKADTLRDVLIDNGWIHIYNSAAVTVKNLDESTRERLVSAVLLKQFLPNYPLRIYEKASDAVYVLREEQLDRSGTSAFELD